MAQQIGDDIKSTDFVIRITSGESLSANDAVYIKTSDGKAYKCDASDTTKIDFIGFVVVAVGSGVSVDIKPAGHMDTFSGLTINAPYYLSAATPGLITATPPTNAKLVGYARKTTMVELVKFPTIRTVAFTASGTWTKLPGLKYIEVEVLGGGASGGGVASGAGVYAGGGGGGSYSKKKIQAGTLGSTEIVTVGAAGSAPTAGANDGNDGGNSSFGSHATANGGAKGLSATTGGTGGTASGGDINITGGTGGDGIKHASTSGGISGRGGNSVFGQGGNVIGGTDSQGGGGKIGTGNGAGGSGAFEGGSSGTNRAGGAGTIGLISVTEFY